MSGAEARELEGRFGDLLESTPDATVIVDANGRLVLVNGQAERLFGYSRAEMVGAPVEILIPEGYRQGHPAFREDYFRDPHPRPMGAGLELYARRKDGSEFPAEISLSPLAHRRTACSRPRPSATSAERRKAEAKFRGLLESAPDAMVIVNREGRIELVNAPGREALRLSARGAARAAGRDAGAAALPRRSTRRTAAGTSHEPRVRGDGRRRSSSTACARTARSSRSRSASARWRRRTACSSPAPSAT